MTLPTPTPTVFQDKNPNTPITAAWLNAIDGLYTSLPGVGGAAQIGAKGPAATSTLRAVQDIFNDFINVKNQGAVGDGITDDTAAINAAIALAVSGDTVWFPRGLYLCTSTIYVPYGVTLRGVGSQQTPDVTALVSQGSIIIGKHTGAAVLSLKGAYACGLFDLVLFGHASVTPKTGLCMGRSSAASAGRHMIQNINVLGYFTKAALYSIASEENVLIGVKTNVLGGLAPHSFFTAESDSLVVDGMTAGSNFTMYVYGFNFLHQANYTGLGIATFCIYIQAGTATQALSFKSGFTGQTTQITASSHIRIQMTGTPLGDIAFDDVGCESSNSAAPALEVLYIGGAGFVLRGLRFSNVGGGQFESGQTNFITVQGGAELEGAFIHCAKTDHPSRFSIVRKSHINIVDQDVHIDYISEGNTLNARQLYLLETAGGDRKKNIANCPAFGLISFGGGAVNDMSIAPVSLFTGTSVYAMVVEVDASTTPNTFKWSINGGVGWVATGVAITGANQTLQDGIVIKFVATTGHLVGSQWSWSAEPYVLMT